MASYQIKIKSSASRELERLPRTTIPKIVAAIKELAENPFPQGVKKLTGFDRTYRIRIGEYRILYNMYDDILVIEIIRIHHRKDAYR